MEEIKEIDAKIQILEEEIAKLRGMRMKAVERCQGAIRLPDGFADIIVLDIEHSERKPIEVCFKALVSGVEFCERINPRCQISEITRKITGITENDLVSCRLVGDVLDDFVKALPEGKLIFVAHNGRSCDYSILLEYFESRMKVSNHLWIDSYHDFDNKIFKKKLSELEGAMQDHSALGDVRILISALVNNWGSCLKLLESYIKLRITENFEKGTCDTMKKILYHYGQTKIAKVTKDGLILKYKLLL